ncbi:MAG: 1-acyl-sn-glycerol-3-phosphate acyltransferase [Lentisphaerae bacterium]|jgi:1-acyl-sn-glycerol-3-phosphate acyltransferase|nr:1-acyl-sn-glycerol-3-phosphate acyltransferase [Lentisphaerota bacterium]
MKYLINADSYDTAARETSRLSAWLRQTRIYFFLRLLSNYYQINRCARQGKLDRARQVYYSEQNLRILEACGASIHIRGLDHIKASEGPFVLVGNHVSALESMLLNAILSPRIEFTYVVKNSLFKTPLIGPPMRSLKAIGVERKNARDDFKVIIDEGRKRLAEGCSVLIFPEATRHREFLPQRFNSIGCKLARSAGVGLIPFALKTDFLAPGWLFREFGPLCPQNQVWFEFGAPFSREALSENDKEVHRATLEFIQSKISAWKQLPQS